MSTDLVLLAVIMAAATYPFRAIPLLAPGFDRLPEGVRHLPPARRPGRARCTGDGRP